jgi:hypothetical protein
VPTPQEQYLQMVTQSQEAARAAFDTWTRTAQEAFGKLPALTPVDPNQVIDEVFDFAGNLLTVQRDFAKHLVATASAATDTVRQGAAKATETVSEA